jgi:hypothetical protein
LLRALASRPATTLLVAGLALLAGCQSEAPHPNTKQQVPFPSPVLEMRPKDLAELSDAYWDFEAWREVTQNGLVSDCVKRRSGRSYLPHSTVEDSRAQAMPDRTYRAEYGYNVWRSGHLNVDAEEPTDPNTETLLLGDVASDRQAVILPNDYKITVPLSGCYAEAREILGGSVAKWAEVEYLPNYLNLHLRQNIARRVGFDRVAKQWSECMAEYSYHYATPAALQTDFQSSYPELPRGVPHGMTFEASEIAAATRDFDCQESTGYARFVMTSIHDLALTLSAEERRAAEAAIQTILGADSRASEVRQSG